MLVDKYKRLMKDFVNEVITVEEFEREYLITLSRNRKDRESFIRDFKRSF